MKVKIQTNDHRDPKAVHERQIVASLTESIAGHLVNYDSIKTVVEILAAYLADVASKTMVDFVAAEPKTELVSYTPGQARLAHSTAGGFPDN